MLGRALLKGEKRFASVRADTKLHTMSISRCDFEAKLGPLADLVPDRYLDTADLNDDELVGWQLCFHVFALRVSLLSYRLAQL